MSDDRRGEKCGNCKFYVTDDDPVDDGDGKCVRHPPVPVGITSSRSASPYWETAAMAHQTRVVPSSPDVLASGWCGEWRLR